MNPKLFYSAFRRLGLLLSATAIWLTATAFTIVLDAGHGGRDFGTIGKTLREKDINLDVALRVKRLLESENNSDFKIVMTRATDVFVPLQERCNIANRAKGDIFVSIHTNSVDAKSPRRSTVEGASVYTLGQRRSDTNLEVAMRENAVIKLEDDYSETYCGFDPTSAESYIMFEMSQSAHLDHSIQLARLIQEELISTAGRKDMGVRQEPFWVLVRTSMPAVLVELDFVCNPSVEDYLATDSGRDELAEAITEGILTYYKANNKNTVATAKPAKKKQTKKAEPKPKAEPQASAADDGAVVYKIQFLTSPRVLSNSDSRLKGMEAEYYTESSTIKYTTGCYATQSEAAKALPVVKKRFPDAFVIKMQGGKRIK